MLLSIVNMPEKKTRFSSVIAAVTSHRLRVVQMLNRYDSVVMSDRNFSRFHCCI